MNRAVEELARKTAPGGGRGAAYCSKAFKELGEHPNERHNQRGGRYGPYIKHGKINVPRDVTLKM